MDVESILHMNTGNEEFSYATNSSLQEIVIQKVLPILNETIKGMASIDGFPSCFKIADLGCSSGPNTLLVIYNIINTVDEIRKENNWKAPQLQVCLNDLYGNDFNTIFKSLPMFYSSIKKLRKGPCFVSAVPGSFYGRLFPDNSLHLVHSSYSIHWLSQVPEGLENNKLKIYMAKTSPPNVFEAYQKQFQTDFTLFLRLRAKEIISGGRMILTFVGRSVADPTSTDCCRLWELLAESLVDMVKEGLVQESKINSFNMPCYNPCEDEVRNVIQNEGSFFLDSLKTFQVNWNPYEKEHTNMNVSYEPKTGKYTAKIIRAVVEPMLASHFGNSVMDAVFLRYEKHVDEHLAIHKTKYFNIVISLTKN